MPLICCPGRGACNLAARVGWVAWCGRAERSATEQSKTKSGGRAEGVCRRAAAAAGRAKSACLSSHLALEASCSWRVQVTFCGSSTTWPPAASILALADALNAAALITSGALSSPVPSTCGRQAGRQAADQQHGGEMVGAVGRIVKEGNICHLPRAPAWTRGAPTGRYGMHCRLAER